MLMWVLYDISETKARTKLSKMCLNKGLYRVQKSVFIGEINKNQVDELTMYAKELINLQNDSIYIFPTEKHLLDATELIGIGFEKELITNEVISRFF